MSVGTFEDLLVWKNAKALTAAIYGSFKNSRDYGFKDQIERASVSIMNNIAEGFERQSNKEFKHFLFIAKGSCGEVRSMMHLANELKYMSGEQCVVLISQATEISKMLSGLIKKL